MQKSLQSPAARKRELIVRDVLKELKPFASNLANSVGQQLAEKYKAEFKAMKLAFEKRLNVAEALAAIGLRYIDDCQQAGKAFKEVVKTIDGEDFDKADLQKYSVVAQAYFGLFEFLRDLRMKKPEDLVERANALFDKTVDKAQSHPTVLLHVKEHELWDGAEQTVLIHKWEAIANPSGEQLQEAGTANLDITFCKSELLQLIDGSASYLFMFHQERALFNWPTPVNWPTPEAPEGGYANVEAEKEANELAEQNAYATLRQLSQLLLKPGLDAIACEEREVERLTEEAIKSGKPIRDEVEGGAEATVPN